MLDDAIDFDTRSSSVGGQLRRIRHDGAGTRRRSLLRLGLFSRGRNQRRRTHCSAFQKTSTIHGTAFGFHGCSPGQVTFR